MSGRFPVNPFSRKASRSSQSLPVPRLPADAPAWLRAKNLQSLRPELHSDIGKPEKASAGPLVRLQLEEIFAIHKHLAACHLVIGVSGNHLGQSAFAGAIRAHDGMHLAQANGEAEIADDLVLANGDT